MKSLTYTMVLVMALTACQTQSPQDREKTIVLESKGTVKVRPNQASFMIYLTCLDKSVLKSRDCLAEKSNELIEVLKAGGILENQILTTSVELKKDYKWVNGSNVFQGYKAATRLNVTVQDLSNLEQLYAQLLENEHLGLGGLNYSHTSFDSLQNEAYRVAMQNASKTADAMLLEMPEKEKEVVQVGNVQFQLSDVMNNANEYKRFAKSEAMPMKAEEPSISMGFGTMAVNATIYVEYKVR